MIIRPELLPPGDVEVRAPIRRVPALQRWARKFVDWCAIWLPVVAGLLLIVSALVYMFGLALRSHHSLAWAVTAIVVIGVLVTATLLSMLLADWSALLLYKAGTNESELVGQHGLPAVEPADQSEAPANPPSQAPAIPQSAVPANDQQLVGGDDHPPQDGMELQDYPQTLSQPQNEQVVQAQQVPQDELGEFSYLSLIL
ncbi:hypothetical protein B0T26DRAFT_734464 [Lasiosphaeria miniovina]|uniref:Uncharacterized protein n=1 Tax=Lasiosphaeria miniovina TaxID=1954250 RepID=A0AA40DI73_9PEZI|nr:uncharacterized protein B0T26DRAFT_734464 [Lasiosphaeria miniovina]KAK0701737.1 hypothetical protein B0T26DRAFT_734464 [Lasiosphaeria miniovina]